MDFRLPLFFVVYRGAGRASARLSLVFAYAFLAVTPALAQNSAAVPALPTPAPARPVAPPPTAPQPPTLAPPAQPNAPSLPAVVPSLPPASTPSKSGPVPDIGAPAEALLQSVANAPKSRRGNRCVLSFAHAKAHLAVLYSERPRTLYSDCVFGPDKHIDYDQCRYRPRMVGTRALRIEWEHVVPAEAFGHAFASWRKGHPSCIDSHGRPFRGRRCAQRADAAYRLMEADLYNLYPEIGEVNQIRSNKPMGEPTQKRREVMPQLASYVGSDAFLPRPDVRGDVARTYQYMDHSYPACGIVGRKRAKQFVAWSLLDPVDAWECRRAWRIEAIQGNENRYVKVPCQEASLWPSDG